MPPFPKQVVAALLPLVAAAPSFAQSTLEAVVVTATRTPTTANEVLADVSVIERAEIERNGQSSLAELLARQPGIQIAPAGGPGSATSLYVRGANSNQTKILIDGLPINSIDASGSPLRFIALADIERIEILRGPAASLYGADTIGGVIQIFTKRPATGTALEAFAGYGSHDTTEASAAIAHGSGPWRFRLDGNHRSSDGFSSRRRAINRDADEDGYQHNAGGAALSYVANDDHEIGLQYRRNTGWTHYDSSPWPDEGLASGHYDNRDRFRNSQWQVFSRNRLAPWWQSTLRHGQARDEQRTYYWDDWAAAGPSETLSLLDTRNTHSSWQNDFRLPLGTLLLAIERDKQRVRPHADYSHDPEISNNSVLAGWSAGHGAHSWQLNARRDDHSTFDGHTTYSAAYGYQLSNTWRVNVGYGKAFKAPSVYQLYSFYGDAGLQPEESRSREATLTWEDGVHTVSATYYLNKVSNLIDYSMSDWKYENVSAARLQGVTLAWRGQFDAWTLSGSYDWLDAEDENTGFELGRRARHSVHLAALRDWGRLSTGVEVSGIGRRFDTHNESGRMGGYGVVNLTARYALRKDLALEARINNLFDKNYETVRHYNTAGLNAFVGLRYSLR